MDAADLPPVPPEPPPPPAPRHLLRLQAIAGALQAGGHALALIGLGSVGRETARLDAHSDLDFFVIVEPGHKVRHVDRLDWLAAAHPLAWHYRNTPDGHKALMADGLLCEFAVFEPPELAHIPYAPGRVVWRRADVPEAEAERWARPQRERPPPAWPDEAWLVGEALSCLFVGLQRWHRGERLSGCRFVQGHALDRLVELDALRHAPRAGSGATPDPFDPLRRLEARQPGLAAELSRLVPGIEATPAAAVAMLEALRARSSLVDGPMAEAVAALARA